MYEEAILIVALADQDPSLWLSLGFAMAVALPFISTFVSPSAFWLSQQNACSADTTPCSSTADSDGEY
jgi:hypothetical protein